jgi:hypothetical protein
MKAIAECLQAVSPGTQKVGFSYQSPFERLEKAKEVVPMAQIALFLQVTG